MLNLMNIISLKTKSLYIRDFSAKSDTNSSFFGPKVAIQVLSVSFLPNGTNSGVWPKKLALIGSAAKKQLQTQK